MRRQQLTPSSASEDENDREDERIEREAEIRRRIKSLPCPGCEQHPPGNDGPSNRYRRDVEPQRRGVDGEGGDKLSTPPSPRHAEQHTVMPFLAEHIPLQYNVIGSGAGAWLPQQQQEQTDKVNGSALRERISTKFCYRHSPSTLNCRRQANEPSMQELQHDLADLSQSDQQAISHVWSLFSAAPAKQRNLMLRGILTQCCFPQLSYITSTVRDLIKIDFLAALPPELAFRVLSYLDTGSLCRAAQVSQRWRSLADDDVVWHKMCEQHIDRKCGKCGWGLPLLERKRLRSERREIRLRASGKKLDYTSPPADIGTPVLDEEQEGGEGREGRPSAELFSSSSRAGQKRRAIEDSAAEPSKRRCSHSPERSGPYTSDDKTLFPSTTLKRRPWKDIYKTRFQVGTNWKHGRFTTRIFRGHTNGVMSLQFDSEHLITGSYDTTAKVWNVQTGEVLRTLRGHTSGIRCLQFDDSKLMTGSLDCTLRLWNWKTGQCLRVFQAHTAGIVTLHFSGPWVASGSMDQTIRVWNSETQSTFLLRGHTDWINCVRVDEASRTLFSASDDLTVRLWDLDNRTCIKVFEGHVGQVQQVVPMPAEFELDEQKTTRLANRDDEDAKSDASGPTSSSHRYENRRLETPEEDKGERERPPFWPNQPDRPAPPRYMLTGALDSTIRLWDVHFNAEKPEQHAAAGNTGQQNQHQQPAAVPPPLNNPPNATVRPFRILPTDPLTNSHTPRAASCLRTFFGHVEGIWTLAADHLRLISGSEDRMLKVWDPRTGKCERTITGHAGPVTCCWLSDWGCASGGEDCEVRMLCFGGT
ncbi:hypothetical protein LTR37_020570 [Vermiconidia calcicola]|uniref:Uncharacterized protein n=1 Tax=Vermiconidia calcicola TaxID=1690605 RepID=A0ACC3MB31_9PEZI|nr:hypothetical protein LTR37_020570 [Vermiconidia calcicola]